MIRRTLSLRLRANTPVVSRQRGFTMIEVLLSVVLVAIGMALAIPSYRDMVEKRQLTNGAEQVAAFVNTAQGISSRSNQVVTVSYSRSANDNWCIGATVGDTACDCTETVDTESDYCAIDDQRFVINAQHAGNLDIMQEMTGDGAFAYDPIRGLFVDLGDSVEMKMRSQSGDFRLNMLVNNTGRVMLCSDSSNHDVPGYDVCPATTVEEVASL